MEVHWYRLRKPVRQRRLGRYQKIRKKGGGGLCIGYERDARRGRIRRRGLEANEKGSGNATSRRVCGGDGARCALHHVCCAMIRGGEQ